MKEDRIFTDEELKAIGNFFEILFRVAKREGILSAPKTDSLKEPPIKQDRMILLTQWEEFHSWPTIGALRWMIFCSYKTGADYFFKKVGKRIVINEALFFQWCNMTDEEKEKNSPDMMKWKGKYTTRKK